MNKSNGEATAHATCQHGLGQSGTKVLDGCKWHVISEMRLANARYHVVSHDEDFVFTFVICFL